MTTQRQKRTEATQDTESARFEASKQLDDLEWKIFLINLIPRRGTLEHMVESWKHDKHHHYAQRGSTSNQVLPNFHWIWWVGLGAVFHLLKMDG